MTIEKMVESAIQRAIDNGYWKVLSEMTDQQIAIDLGTYDAELENTNLTSIETAVTSLRQERPNLIGASK